MAATLHGYWGTEKTVNVGALVVSAGATVDVDFGGPVAVKRLILCVTTALTSADGKLIISVRDRDGGNNTDHSAYTLPYSGSAADDVWEILLAVPDTAAVTDGADGLDVHNATPILLEVSSAQELLITADSAPGAGAVDIWAQVQELGFHTGASNTGSSTRLVREAV